MKFRKRYEDPNNDTARASTRARNDEPSKTQQHHAANCDLNKIMKDYGVTGNLPIIPYPAEAFGEDDLDLDLTSAYERVQTADAYFSQLPSNLRSFFKHSPLAMWAWVNDPKNHDEAVQLGILHRDSPLPAAPAAENSTDHT